MKKANRKRREKRKCRLKIIKRRKKEKGERRKKKKRKRKRVEERKKKKWDIGGVEGCGKVEGKGGSPEASGDDGGRLCQSSKKSSNSFFCGTAGSRQKLQLVFLCFAKPFFFFLAFRHIINETEKVHTTKGVKNL